ncbi:Hypothetical predicted protein [Olea europaea subsp. europaea]|uniref:Uncharacterized protein n=1 Tax=Olea europaea subsp. europaea TaxID=158383 RepID=A0A8S0RVR8_OLEEU|nr:Hypothetical predicted protein [Olea europaea subsp. europaea]
MRLWPCTPIASDVLIAGDVPIAARTIADASTVVGAPPRSQLYSVPNPFSFLPPILSRYFIHLSFLLQMELRLEIWPTSKSDVRCSQFSRTRPCRGRSRLLVTGGALRSASIVAATVGGDCLYSNNTSPMPPLPMMPELRRCAVASTP